MAKLRATKLTVMTSETKSPIAAYPCPACAGTVDHRFRFDVNGCGIWKCQSCGLGRTEAAAFDPAAYYTAGYFSGQRSDGYADYLGAEPVLRREFARSVEFIRRFRDRGKLLELGCAYGFFLQAVQPYFEVSGIERVAEAAEHARRSGLNVLCGMADENNMQRGAPFDVIVLFDVIEHLPEPQATLALCERHLNPGGIVVIATGDFASLLARLTGRHWRLMTPPQHLWFFTRVSLRRMANSVGLSLEYADHPWKVVPLSLIFFQLRRMLGFRSAPAATNRVGVPVNLFDAMRVVLRKPAK
jgi:SAM-dependent methyltransferase